MNSTWCPRPPSNSFSEVETQQQQRRLRPKLPSANFHHRKQTSFQPQTLYAINQSNNEDSIPPTRKRSSFVDFPEEESKGKP